LAQLLQAWLETEYLNQFLRANLLTILIALLAINSATTGIVLTKIRELVEARGKAELFSPTRRQMILAVREQVGLIAAAVILLTLSSSPYLRPYEELLLLVNSLIVGIFVYGLQVLYDTAIGVLIIVDFKLEE